MTNSVLKTYFLNLICLIIILILEGCAPTKSSSNTVKLYNNLNNNIKQKYDTDNGYLIALYNLIDMQENSIFNKEYVKIINNSENNKIFLNRLRPSKLKKQSLESKALTQIRKIRNLLLSIDAKYDILSRSERARIRTQDGTPLNIFESLSISARKKNSHLKDLYSIDKIMQNIPVLLPEYMPRITSHYGVRKHPLKKQMKHHTGIDLAVQKEGIIYSAAKGKVTRLDEIKGYGKTIEITHHRNIMTRYTHLSSYKVKLGQTILRGQAIARQGSTGNVTAEHLHFEIWIKSGHVNPYDFISHACNNSK